MSKTKQIKFISNYNKLYDELSEWMQGNDHDGGLEYAFRQGYDLHAVQCWENSGASKYNFSAGIDHKAELKQIKELCKSADIYVCPDCNHHGFYEKGELLGIETPQCMSCLGNNMKLDKGERK